VEQTVRVLRFKDLKQKVGLSRAHVDRLEAAGKFPKRIQLGPKSVAWLETEVESWLREKAESREAA
jgi:prophage regulatory protein